MTFLVRNSDSRVSEPFAMRKTGRRRSSPTTSNPGSHLFSSPAPESGTRRMVALKASEVEAFIARPDPDRRIVLVFGPDAGLVHERVETIVGSAIEDPHDPFLLARIDGDTLLDEPQRLVEEAQTIPLFGGRRAVWVKAGNRNFAAAVEALIAAPPTPDCLVVIE